jgi:hypothetical protein
MSNGLAASSYFWALQRITSSNIEEKSAHAFKKNCCIRTFVTLLYGTSRLSCDDETGMSKDTNPNISEAIM